MVAMPAPTKHPKTGVYYTRVVIPEDVRHAFENKTEFKLSLGTKDVAEAQVKHAEALAEFYQRRDAARLPERKSDIISVERPLVIQGGISPYWPSSPQDTMTPTVRRT